jgi:Zn-dependent M28 family amino/carboxypeptidase
MELARRFSQRATRPARRLVFIAFTAEERGIIGSNYYLEHPLFPLDSTVAMLNFDMIGHLREEGLLLGGVRTAREFSALLETVNESGQLTVKPTNSLGGSDHAGFYRNGIPVLFFFTGLTDVYHTPDDDYDTINVEGVAYVVDFAEQLVDAILNLPERPEYLSRQRPTRGRGAMAYLGVVPDYGGNSGDGLRLTDVAADSPAAQAGLEKNDVIVKIGDMQVTGIRDLADGLRKYKAGQTIDIVVIRDDDQRTFGTTLGEPRRDP